MTRVLDAILGSRGIVAYIEVGGPAFGEAALLIGLFLPGEVAVLLGGVLASQGQVSLPVMVVVASFAAVAGDAVGYEIGRRPVWRDGAHALRQLHGVQRHRQSGVGDRVRTAPTLAARRTAPSSGSPPGVSAAARADRPGVRAAVGDPPGHRPPGPAASPGAPCHRDPARALDQWALPPPAALARRPARPPAEPWPEPHRDRRGADRSRMGGRRDRPGPAGRGGARTPRRPGSSTGWTSAAPLRRSRRPGSSSLPPTCPVPPPPRCSSRRSCRSAGGDGRRCRHCSPRPVRSVSPSSCSASCR